MLFHSIYVVSAHNLQLKGFFLHLKKQIYIPCEANMDFVFILVFFYFILLHNGNGFDLFRVLTGYSQASLLSEAQIIES